MREETGSRKKPVADTRRGNRRGGEGLRVPMERKRAAAKTGMTVSMGALIVTGLMRGRGARTLHIWSGLALVGFSVWHHKLYQTASRGNHI